MVIDIQKRLETMRLRRAWSRTELVRSIDPSGERFRMDSCGRLMAFEEYGQLSMFGWTIHGASAINHRSAAGDTFKKPRKPRENSPYGVATGDFMPIMTMISAP